MINDFVVGDEGVSDGILQRQTRPSALPDYSNPLFIADE